MGKRFSEEFDTARILELKKIIESEFGYSGFMRVASMIYNSQAFKQPNDAGRTAFKTIGKKLRVFAINLERFER